MSKLRPYQQDTVDAILAMDPDKPFKLAVPMGSPGPVHGRFNCGGRYVMPYDPAKVRAVTITGQLALLALLEHYPAPPLALPAPVGTHCAGCGKYREHRRGRWLCLACVVVPSRDKDVEALRQEYL